MPRPQALTRTAVLALVASLFLPTVASAQGTCMTACGTSSGGGMTCMISGSPFVCPAFWAANGMYINYVDNSVSADCGVSMLTGLMRTVIHPPGSGPNSGTQALCRIAFARGCVQGTMVAYDNNEIFCNADFNDGLPVELMDFTVEPGDTAQGATETAEPEPAAQ